uniref:Uncharacterized protein n=1 Tax=Parastrongyloides trichosuri TaxID=131310 RepID=A0A0N4ZB62_PARTI
MSSEVNEIFSLEKMEEKTKLLLMLKERISSGCPIELSPEENKRRILRDVYKKKINRYGLKTKYYNSIVFTSNIYSLIYPFAGEFAVTCSDGQFLPFDEKDGFTIHKVYTLDLSNVDELANFDFEVFDIHAKKLGEYISGNEKPQNSVHYVVKILNQIKYNNKEWTVVYFLYYFLVNAKSRKLSCYLIFAIFRYLIWISFVIVLVIRFIYTPIF